jgi:hypothetical protein
LVAKRVTLQTFFTPVIGPRRPVTRSLLRAAFSSKNFETATQALTALTAARRIVVRARKLKRTPSPPHKNNIKIKVKVGGKGLFAAPPALPPPPPAPSPFALAPFPPLPPIKLEEAFPVEFNAVRRWAQLLLP